MAVIQQFSITRGSNVSVPVPKVTITAQVFDNAGHLLADFTGANALVFPAVVTTLTVAQQADLADLIAEWLVLRKAGL
jgi:hypothetical protein